MRNERKKLQRWSIVTRGKKENSEVRRQKSEREFLNSKRKDKTMNNESRFTGSFPRSSTEFGTGREMRNERKKL